MCGRIDRFVAALEQFLLDEVLQQSRGRSLLWAATGTAPARPREMMANSPQLLAQHAVIAALGFFDLFEVGLQILLAEQRRAVQPLQLLVARVPFPVRTGDRQQLEGFDLAGVGDVRSATQVDELALPVEAERIVLGQPRLDVLDLQLLIQIVAQFDGFVAVQREPLERLRLLDDLLHLLFDPWEIIVADLMLQVEVVVEAVGQCRPERQRNAGIQPHHGPSHHVRTRVPQHAQGFGIAVGQQP